MTDDNAAEKPEINVSSDENWKDRVKTEDAGLDEQGAEEVPAAKPGEQHIKMEQLPPANFSMLVQMFATQAMVALGVIPSPEGKQLQQLPLAKHFIDLLGVLEEKCKGNMTTDEAKLLEQSAYELRMAYVQLTKKTSAS